MIRFRTLARIGAVVSSLALVVVYVSCQSDHQKGDPSSEPALLPGPKSRGGGEDSSLFRGSKSAPVQWEEEAPASQPEADR
jgi:hypothetical protein